MLVSRLLQVLVPTQMLLFNALGTLRVNLRFAKLPLCVNIVSCVRATLVGVATAPLVTCIKVLWSLTCSIVL